MKWPRLDSLFARLLLLQIGVALALVVVFGAVGAISAHLLRSREPEAFATMGRHRPSEVGLP